MGFSGVDASSKVFNVASPPGLDNGQLLFRSSQSLLTHPAPITAIRIAGPLSVADMVLQIQINSFECLDRQTMLLC
jgi:hypothetical protein